MTFYSLDMQYTDPARLKRERDKARKLKKTHWWQQRLKAGVCHYCEECFDQGSLTMDHVVPLARGGGKYEGEYRSFVCRL